MSIRNMLTDPTRLPLVAPSILAADFSRMGAECQSALEAGADLIHLDVMDGHFVPNLTMGPDLCRSLHQALPRALLDVHLMVTDPGLFIDPFAEAGAGHLTFHIEAVPDPAGLARRVRNAGMTCGLALNPSTGVDAVEPYLDLVDLVLVMSVNPGYAGQSFMPAVLDKARALGPRLRRDQRLQVDGGVGPETVEECRAAGCDVLVAASAVFNSGDYRQAIEVLRGSASVSQGA